MSEDQDKTTEQAASEARGAELRENIALTDARRTEEERAEAEKEAERAHEEAEKLSRKEQRQREKAERLHAEADRARERAAAAAPVASPSDASAEPTAAALPGMDRLPPAAQRTEVLVGAAFAGSFLVARILKRLFD
jgi:translation initiation factor IF-2